MRAAVVSEPGQAPVWAEHPDPTPAAGHTLVTVTAAPIAPLDQLCASGTSYFGRPATPYVPGVQGVGVVERSDVLPDGARVFFSTAAGMAPGDGSLAERCLSEGSQSPINSAEGLLDNLNQEFVRFGPDSFNPS